MICCCFLMVVQGWGQCDTYFFSTYLKKGDSILNILEKGKKANYQKAMDFYNTAILICPDSAQKARNQINRVFEKIQQLRIEADSSKNIALKKTEEAEDSARAAREEREKSYINTLSNAPYKYVRLIRDGPRVLDQIRDSFDVKLLAYCNHLDSLQKPLDTLPGIREEYKGLMDALYFNNDLYEKVYYGLRSHDAETIALNPDMSGKAGQQAGFNTRYLNGGHDRIHLNDTAGIVLINSDTLPSRQKISAFCVSDSLSMIYCATEDHLITAYHLGPNGKITDLKDTIAMGTIVTALHFDEESRIIFFGTISGDLGFIRYHDTAGRRNQPVYDIENSLGSKITAVELFKQTGLSFFLATAIDRKAVVYKVDSNFLKPGHKFSGNFLPPNQQIEEIGHARYLYGEGKVLLSTKTRTGKEGTEITYLWNPFSKEILEQFKVLMKKVKREAYDREMMAPENKFY